MSGHPRFRIVKAEPTRPDPPAPHPEHVVCRCPSCRPKAVWKIRKMNHPYHVLKRSPNLRRSLPHLFGVYLDDENHNHKRTLAHFVALPGCLPIREGDGIAIEGLLS